MVKASREFQVFAKPIGASCNLDCHYCYYLKKESLAPPGEPLRMPAELLEEYIVQHINAFPGPEIRFSWHGGEPTLLGLDYFRQITALQRKHQPPHQRIRNGIQTNGILLDEAWGRFLAAENFAVGLSLDGPPELHDLHRVTQSQQPTHAQALRGYELLRRHRIACDLLCVVNAQNVRRPAQVYRFFKQINAPYVTFLPLVEPQAEVEDGIHTVAVTDSVRGEPVEPPVKKPFDTPSAALRTGLRANGNGFQSTGFEGGVNSRTVPAEAFGEFLCAIFDEWVNQDIGRIKVQIFEEAARTAFGQEHSLCIFRPVCGDIPVVEHNGAVYACDHFVDPAHCLGNLRTTPLAELLESPAQMAFGRAKLATLPRYCQGCEVKAMCQGECPKNRFSRTPDGEAGLNYLCAGYKRFFTHCQPFVQAVAAQWRQQTRAQQRPPVRTTGIGKNPQPGRNDPCPCGSGLKYKKCCLDKPGHQ